MSATVAASSVESWCGFLALRMVYCPAGKSSNNNLGKVCKYGFLQSILRLLRHVPSIIINRILVKSINSFGFNSGGGSIPKEVSSGVTGYSNTVCFLLVNFGISNTSPISIWLLGKLKCSNLAVPLVSVTSSGCCSINISISVLTLDARWQMQVIFGRRQAGQIWRFKLKVNSRRLKVSAHEYG